MATLITSDAALQDFVNANNLFTASFYKETVKNNEPNFLMSPYSAETVLTFVQSGCKGETAQEIRNSLHLPADNDKVESAVKESLAVLKGNDKYTLHTANKMYVKEGFQINEGFKNTATDVYQANIENIDFVLNEQAADTMNSWVESQTNNKIKNLISPDILDNNTATVLINALYFKGNWTNRFVNYTTKEEDFYKTNKDVVKVDTMHHYREWFNYCENSVLNAKFLELPFEGEDISMIIVLPNEKEGLASLENQIEKVFAPQNFTREFLNVALPKFKVESTLELKNTLKNLLYQNRLLCHSSNLNLRSSKQIIRLYSTSEPKVSLFLQEEFQHLATEA
ncbi:Serpin domain containing protein [Asbolus verrucosus]|uniref:Serpin domain containing protein n=1 Tax=Asbolus verrucosus TaxID=1661398 RepID=A0A482VIV7_ASBVE|nr:Serpin domain containing protein [Asbolus verrucosus]